MDHRHERREPGPRGDEDPAPLPRCQAEPAQGQLDLGARPEGRLLDEAGSSPARAGADEQPEEAVLDPDDRIVPPGVIAHEEAGVLSRDPWPRIAVDPQDHVPGALAQPPLGGQHGMMLAGRQGEVAVGGLRAPSHGLADRGVSPGAQDLAGRRHPAHHRADDAEAPCVLAAEVEPLDRGGRAQWRGSIAPRRGGKPVEDAVGVRGVVLEGQRGAGLRGLDEPAQTGDGGFGQKELALGDAPLEAGVPRPARALLTAPPVGEQRRRQEGDDLGGRRPLA